MKLSMLVLGSLFLSAVAFGEPRRFECNFTDNIFRYRDVITLNDNGQARVESSVLASDIGESSFACVAESATYTEAQGIVKLAGVASCVDGSEGKFEKTLDLNRMELNGGWQGAVACRTAE